MLNLIAAGATYLFLGGRALRLVKDGINVTNSTNYLILIKNITLIVIDCCTPPSLRLAAHCVAAGLNRFLEWFGQSTRLLIGVKSNFKKIVCYLCLCIIV